MSQQGLSECPLQTHRQLATDVFGVHKRCTCHRGPSSGPHMQASLALTLELAV